MNDNFNQYKFEEGVDFDGLTPKLAKRLGKTMVTGKVDKPVVSFFDPTANGVDSMLVVSPQLVAQVNIDDRIVKPEKTKNTEEQDGIADTIAEQLESGNKNVTIENGTINNFVIPEDVTVLAVITGEFQNGAQIKSESSKAFTIVNTSEEPVDIVLEANNTVYLQGKYNNIYLNGKSISAASGKYAEISGEVSVDPDLVGNVAITANFVGDNASVKYVGSDQLTISNSGEEPKLTVYAPYATVNMGGKYDELTATVSDDTLILKAAFHANKLNVLKGSVLFYGVDINDFANEIVNPNIEYRPYTLDITTDNFSKLTSNPGIYNIVEDIEKPSSIGFGILASGKYIYNLNGHEVKCGTKNYSMFLRGSVNVTVNGEGKFINIANSYGVWVSSQDATFNVYGGDFEAYTHVLYAEKGTINVYGGTFKMLGDGDLDPKGHYKFLLNCYDASYQSGIAKINVYGGKFYNFNPAESYGEPGGPVSFVAEGYHVVESVEDGIPVFEVVKD